MRLSILVPVTSWGHEGHVHGLLYPVKGNPENFINHGLPVKGVTWTMIVSPSFPVKYESLALPSVRPHISFVLRPPYSLVPVANLHLLFHCNLFKPSAHMAPGCWFFRALWLPLMLAVAAADDQVEACWGSANKCGNTTISRPFWLADPKTGRTCGSLDFEVTCNKSTPIILHSAAISLGFAIVNISYVERSLHVVDLGKRYLLQHASNICQAPIWNTSAKLSAPFRIDPVNLGLVLYSCTEAAGAAAMAQDGELVQTGMRCGNTSKVFVRAGGRYNDTGGYPSYDGCDAAVTPVVGAYGEANASEYEQLINDGFLMTWDPPPPRHISFKVHGRNLWRPFARDRRTSTASGASSFRTMHLHMFPDKWNPC